MKFWTRLWPRPLARENSAIADEINYLKSLSRAGSGTEKRLRQFAFALRDASLGQDVCPKIS